MLTFLVNRIGSATAACRRFHGYAVAPHIFRPALMVTCAVWVGLATHAATGAADSPHLKTTSLTTQASPYRMAQYDCAKERVNQVIIEGTVELVHPDDSPDVSPPEIRLTCQRFQFLKGSQLRTRARLYVHGSEVIEGAVDIVNTRGADGADARANPSIDAVSRAPSGMRGTHGEPGDDGDDGREGEKGDDGEGGEGKRFDYLGSRDLRYWLYGQLDGSRRERGNGCQRR